MSLKLAMISLLAFQYQAVTSQCIPQISQQISARSVIQPRCGCITKPTIITDCTPGVCQNLADTLQLMIVCNLLQNNCGCNYCNSIPTCRCANTISPSVISPNACSRNVLSPSVISPGYASSNVISPSLVSNVFGNDCVPSLPVSGPYGRLLNLLSC